MQGKARANADSFWSLQLDRRDFAHYMIDRVYNWAAQWHLTTFFLKMAAMDHRKDF